MTLRTIHEDLASLKEDVAFIKKHLFDPDCIMNSEEAEKFEVSLQEFKERKTTSLQDLKQKIGL